MYIEQARERSKETFKMILFYTLMSQGLIFLRTKLMAQNIAGHYNVDSYLVALLGATYLAEILSEGLLVTLVPVFHKVVKEDGDEGRFRFVNNLVNIMMIFAITMMFIGLIFAPVIVNYHNEGLVGEDLDFAIKLFRMALPMVFFILVRPVYLAYLQSNHGFKAGAKGGMYMNLVYFLYLLLFTKFGVKGLVVAGVLAHASYFLVIPGIVKGQGYKYERVLDFKDINLLRLLNIFLPMIVYILVMRANAKVDVLFSNEIGNIYGVLGNANYMTGFIITVIIQGIITISYPLLSECYINEDEKSYMGVLDIAIKIIIKILIPVMLVVIIFAEPITNLFFGSGKGLFFKKNILDGVELERTIMALKYLGSSIIFIGLNLLLVRALFSRHDFVGPIVISIISIIINYITGKIFIGNLGEVAIALSKTVANISMGIMLIMRLNYKDKLIDIKGVLRYALRVILLSGIVVGVIYICYKYIGENDVGLITGFVLSSYVYYDLYAKVEKNINLK